jgi:hypothetical protein
MQILAASLTRSEDAQHRWLGKYRGLFRHQPDAGRFLLRENAGQKTQGSNVFRYISILLKIYIL